MDKTKKGNHKTEIRRIGGYLKEVVTFFDSSGKPLSHAINPMMVELRPRDVMQIFVGAILLATPLSFTEEVWTLSESLKNSNAIMLLSFSITAITLFVYFSFYKFKLKGHLIEFLKRVFAICAITLLSSALILFLIDKLPLDTAPITAIKRVILVSFPAFLVLHSVIL